jgi:hypothetical protein
MILLRKPHGKAITARLTTAHAASSYGVPVLVLKDGSALGPADVALNGYHVRGRRRRNRIG